MVRRVIVISFFGVVIPVCAPRSGHPADGTSNAAEVIREALSGLDLRERVWGSVRPMVTRMGTPYVHIGMVRADAAEKTAEATGTLAEAVQQAQLGDTAERSVDCALVAASLV